MNPVYKYIKEDLTCIDNGYKPSNMHEWGPGVRNIYVLHYVISGKGYFVTNNTTYSLKAGDSFIIFPNMEVYYYPDSHEPWEYIWVDFKGDEAERLLAMIDFAIQTPVVRESPQNLEPLYHIMENSTVSLYERERHKAKLHLLLSYYMEYYPRTNAMKQTDYVSKAKEYIENNYYKITLRVSDIVNFVKIDRTYLFRLFKEEVGLSILDYLTSYRIGHACDLLKSSELSVKSVAYSVGYQDQMYFSKVFKKVTSYTPSEYKRRAVMMEE